MADNVADLVADLVDWFHDQNDGDDPVESWDVDGGWLSVKYESGHQFMLHVTDDD